MTPVWLLPLKHIQMHVCGADDAPLSGSTYKTKVLLFNVYYFLLAQ